MNSLSLSWSYLKKKKLNTFLNIILLGLGVGTILFLLLVYRQITDKFNNNYKDINVVVGAKGSSIQLILSSMYHIDNPVGNIKLEDVKFIENSRFVEKAIKISLGDNYQNFRIVGTEHSYPKLYEARLAQGRLWKKPMEVTIGNRVAQVLDLKVGDTFFGGHGNEAHKHASFKVVGIFETTRTVIDKLILCDYKSFWILHPKEDSNLIKENDETHDHEEGEHDHEEGEHDHEEGEHDHEEDEHKHEEDEHKHEEGEHNHEEGEHKHEEDEHKHEEDEHKHEEGAGEITALLVQYGKNKEGNVKSLAPVMVGNRLRTHEKLQGAEPALEINNLLEMMGVGKNLAQYFAYILILIAGLSVFIALYNALKERRYDLAIMRTLGGSKTKLFTNIILEGLMLVFWGGLLGFILAHSTVEILGQWFDVSSQIAFTGYMFASEEFWIVGLIFLVGLLASLIPALQVYRLDISETLSE